MQRAHPPERSLQPLLVAPADVAVDPFRQQALSARIPQGSLDGCHALPISLNKRQRGLSIVSASPLNCAISKVAGIKASESSGSAAFFNMRKPLSIGMFVRARFETGLFRFPSGGPAHAAWLSRRLPGKLISAGSCGCASGGQPGMSAHPTAFRFSVRRDRANPVFCRARPGGCP